MSNFLTPEEDGGKYDYFQINRGAFTQASEEWVEGAKMRKYEITVTDEKTGEWVKEERVKWEKRFKKIDGMITGLEVKEGKFGENLFLAIADVDNPEQQIKIQISVSSNYFTSFAKIAKNIDLMECVELMAYDFLDDDKKRVIWISVKQDGKKVANFYYDSEAKKNLNGLPEVDRDAADAAKAKWEKHRKKFWKDYFTEVEFFLVDEINSIEVPDILGNNIAEAQGDEVTPEDIPEGTTPEAPIETSTPEPVAKKAPATLETADEIFADSAME